ncbi:hypothetical protein BJ742DRAFT_823008 [Cladochytrium replicatum]|nr:hypothetical protein BJ742DRAFT_823008 [Cladochytrium replicatum]
MTARLAVTLDDLSTRNLRGRTTTTTRSQSVDHHNNGKDACSSKKLQLSFPGTPVKRTLMSKIPRSRSLSAPLPPDRAALCFTRPTSPPHRSYPTATVMVLPYELLREMLSYLTFQDLHAVKNTTRRLRSIATDLLDHPHLEPFMAARSALRTLGTSSTPTQNVNAVSDALMKVLRSSMELGNVRQVFDLLFDEGLLVPRHLLHSFVNTCVRVASGPWWKSKRRESAAPSTWHASPNVVAMDVGFDAAGGAGVDPLTMSNPSAVKSRSTSSLSTVEFTVGSNLNRTGADINSTFAASAFARQSTASRAIQELNWWFAGSNPSSLSRLPPNFPHPSSPASSQPPRPTPNIPQRTPAPLATPDDESLRRRRLALCRLVGEFLSVHWISERNVHELVRTLLQHAGIRYLPSQPGPVAAVAAENGVHATSSMVSRTRNPTAAAASSDAVVCLCELLMCAGKELDRTDAKSNNPYYRRMAKLLDSPHLSPAERVAILVCILLLLLNLRSFLLSIDRLFNVSFFAVSSGPSKEQMDSGPAHSQRV